MRSTKVSCSATRAAKPSSTCCWLSAKQVASSPGSSCKVADVAQGADGFTVQTDCGPQTCAQLVVVTGGLSIPKIGATDWGQRLAVRPGHRLVPLRPALVPLDLRRPAWGPGPTWRRPCPSRSPWAPARKPPGSTGPAVHTPRPQWPAVLQISSYWTEGQALSINLAPGQDLSAGLVAQKTQSKRQLQRAAAVCPRAAGGKVAQPGSGGHGPARHARSA